MRFITLCAVMLVSGCAPMQWLRQDGSLAAQADVEQCEDTARAQVRARPYPYLAVGPVIVQDSFSRNLGMYAGCVRRPLRRSLRRRKPADERLPARSRLRAQAEMIQPSPAGASAGMP